MALNLVLEAVLIELSQSLNCPAQVQLFMCFFLFLAACIHSDKEFNFFAFFVLHTDSGSLT